MASFRCVRRFLHSHMESGIISQVCSLVIGSDGGEERSEFKQGKISSDCLSGRRGVWRASWRGMER